MDPVSKLNRQIVRLEGRIADLQTRADRLANVRLITGFGALAAVLAVGAFGPPWAFWLALALGVIGFGAAVIAHRRLTVAVDRFSGWLAIKRRHVARATLDWEALPPSPLTPAPEHAFEQDIDLLDLHRMLNTCASAGGAHLLYDWLTVHRPDPAVIEARQALVADLTPLAPFRDKLELAGQGVRPLHFDPEPVPAALPPIIAAMGLLAAVDVVLFGLVLLERIAPLVLVAALAVYGGLFLLAFPLTNRTLSTAIDSTDVLHRLSVVTGFIEGYRYGHSDRLRQAAAPILNDRPSAALGGLGWLAGAASMRRNPFLWVPLNVIVPWDPVVAWLLMRRINALAPKLDGWLACWHRLEALSALAAFSWLRPAATFPRLDEGGPLFAAEAMGHPLLRDPVTNDFRLDDPGTVVIITGSNMAGKSSFLRTVGVTMRLAYAGSTVLAGSLTLRPMRLFSVIRVTDSLEDGISFFYAEVRQLRALLDDLRREDGLPLFYVIDEIFRGTNNRERLIGSRAYIRALLAEPGAGLIATHDLELTRLAEEHESVRNMHFREEVAGGRMVFDYRLRPGPCPTTNALLIMAMEGLPVE